MAKKLKIVDERPLYPGESVTVKWFHLKKQQEDEQPLGCICTCSESNAKGKSKRMMLPQRGNLVAALKRLLSAKEWIDWVLDRGRGFHLLDGCEYCNGDVFLGLRISEDWCIGVCEVCKRRNWGSTYTPPRRPPPFTLEEQDGQHSKL